MKLLTEKIKKALPKIHATEGISLIEKMVICKFFNPCGKGTWYAVEGQLEEDDFIFWGLVDLHEQEWGYFSLKELEAIRLPFDLRIERDIFFESEKICDIWKG